MIKNIDCTLCPCITVALAVFLSFEATDNT